MRERIAELKQQIANLEGEKIILKSDMLSFRTELENTKAKLAHALSLLQLLLTKDN